jgi:hypothetical protein
MPDQTETTDPGTDKTGSASTAASVKFDACGPECAVAGSGHLVAMARVEFNRMVEELCRVQPMPESAMRIFTDGDPLVHALLSNFVARAQGKPLPYPYKKAPPYLDITRDVVEGSGTDD